MQEKILISCCGNHMPNFGLERRLTAMGAEWGSVAEAIITCWMSSWDFEEMGNLRREKCGGLVVVSEFAAQV